MRLHNKLGVLIAVILLGGLSMAVTSTAAHAQPPSSGSDTLLAGVFNPIRNVANGMCLQPAGGSTALFEAIVQRPCDRSVAQGWQFLQLGRNHYQFVNQASGLCMNAFDGAFNFARVLQNECKRVSNNEWNTNATLPDVVSLESRVGFRNTRRCVHVPGGGDTTDGLAMILFGCNGSTPQRWVVGFA